MLSPRLRQTAYGVGSVATTVVTLLALWHGIDGGTADALANAITGLLGLLGVGATGIAGATVARQRKEGTLDFTGSAAGQVLSDLPAVGPLVQQVIDAVKLP